MMTKSEAITQMMRGKKLTHKSFTPEEWVTMGNEGQYVLEDGVECSGMEFWQWRLGYDWNDGWELWTTKV